MSRSRCSLTTCSLRLCSTVKRSFFFFNDSAPTQIYTLSLHDALPIFVTPEHVQTLIQTKLTPLGLLAASDDDAQARSTGGASRSEEHTSELQSRRDLVCRLLLEKKKKHRAPA